MVSRVFGTSDPGTFNPRFPDIVVHSPQLVLLVLQTYQPGQVLVSTGNVNTGFIKLNANPNDTMNTIYRYR